MISAPPLEDGGLHVTLAELLPAVADTLVGAPGGTGGAGVTAFDGADAGPADTPLTATTEKVYEVPLVSPLMIAEVGGGDPLSTRAACGFGPMKGVIV